MSLEKKKKIETERERENLGERISLFAFRKFFNARVAARVVVALVLTSKADEFKNVRI